MEENNHVDGHTDMTSNCAVMQFVHRMHKNTWPEKNTVFCDGMSCSMVEIINLSEKFAACIFTIEECCLPHNTVTFQKTTVSTVDTVKTSNISPDLPCAISFPWNSVRFLMQKLQIFWVHRYRLAARKPSAVSKIKCSSDLFLFIIQLLMVNG